MEKLFSFVTTSFAYVVPLPYYGVSGHIKLASDAWVEGRYVNHCEELESGAVFENHPEADIIKRNVTYTDRYGVTHTQDVVYEYDRERDEWIAPWFYTNSFAWNPDQPLPPELVLTRQEAEALVKGGYDNRNPEKGLVYDGTEPPGTPFATIYVTGVTLSKNDIEMAVWGDAVLTAAVTPASATDGRLSWTSSNEDIVAVYASSGFGTEVGIYGKAEGTAVITAATIDGSFTAACTVTVTSKKQAVRGEITSFGQLSEQTTVELWQGDVKVDSAECPTYYFTGTECLTAYSFSADPGAYTLKVSKASHVTRTYDIAVTDSAVTQAVEIRLKGDISGDGEITARDNTLMLRHIRETSKLTGYELQCADLSGDGEVTSKDKTLLLRHIRETAPLWQRS